MDSGNSSGSLQSSSGGDEEYDSRAESSISAFMINNTPPPLQNHVGHGPFTISTTTNSHTLPQQQQQQQQQHHHNTHMFDSLSNYLDPMQRSPSLPNSNALLNLDMMWSKPSRSELNQTNLGGFMPLSSQPQNQQALLSAQVPVQTIRDSAAFLATQQHPLPDPQSASRGLLSVSAANNSDQPHNTKTNVVRNPKKRPRASRRAPTTVLTTDTTNFRAMVQEFTGIPAPPFTSSPFPRSRFDLFGSAVSTSSTVRSTTLLEPSPPPYLLRPFAQKPLHHPLHPFPPSTPSFPPSSISMVDTLLASNNSTNSATNSTSINYQLSSSSTVDHLGLLKQHPLNFNNVHNNPILSFQNILQAPPKFPLANPSVLASKTQPSLEIPPPSTGDSHLKVGVFEELGLRHPHVNNNTDVSGLHQNIPSSPSVGALPSGNINNLSNASTEWTRRTGTITNNDCEHGGGGGLGVTVNYSDVAERVTNGKVRYSASSSDFRGEKGTECTVAARSEGMVESWINCSSD